MNVVGIMEQIRVKAGTYLIFVSNATNGVGVLFQAGVLFSTGNAKGTALSKVYSYQI